MTTNVIVEAAEAHRFGLGISVLERQAANRRGMAALAAVLPEVLDQIARRCVQQAFSEAMPGYWLARAERLEQVGTPWADEAAVNCRRHSWLLATAGPPKDLVGELDEALAVIVREVA